MSIESRDNYAARGDAAAFINGQREETARIEQNVAEAESERGRRHSG